MPARERFFWEPPRLHHIEVCAYVSETVVYNPRTGDDLLKWREYHLSWEAGIASVEARIRRLRHWRFANGYRMRWSQQACLRTRP